MAELGSSLGGLRTDMDRYREFRLVFLSTEAGKRVLHDILAWGHIYRSSKRPDPHDTSFREGERNLALKIMTAIHVEPQTERPQRQQSTEPQTGD